MAILETGPEKSTAFKTFTREIDAGQNERLTPPFGVVLRLTVLEGVGHCSVGDGNYRDLSPGVTVGCIANELTVYAHGGAPLVVSLGLDVEALNS